MCVCETGVYPKHDHFTIAVYFMIVSVMSNPWIWRQTYLFFLLSTVDGCEILDGLDRW